LINMEGMIIKKRRMESMNGKSLLNIWAVALAAVALVLVGKAGPAKAETLRMGLIPAENNEEMVQRFEPMRVYLEKKIGRSINVFTATDYTGVIEAMRKKRVDIAWFGPLSYVLAEQEAGAEAFAVGVRKSTGKEFFGKFIYAGSHDAVEMAVKNKTVDAGADNDITYNKMLDKGLITKETNRVLLYSDPLPGSPLAYRSDLDDALKQKIRDAILYAHYDIDVTGYGELSRYEAAAPQDYESIRDLVKQLNLRKEQILK